MPGSVQWHTVATLLLLRGKMGIRICRSLGWLRAILLAGTLIAFVFPLFEVMEERFGAIYILGFTTLILAAIHFNRKDNHFICSLGVWPPRQYLAEYGLLALPATMVMIFLKAWFTLAALILICAVLAVMPMPGKSASSSGAALRMPVSVSYDWAAGLRRYRWTLAVLYIAGLAGSVIHLFLGWVLMLMFTATIGLFYRQCEPESFILLEHSSSRYFLMKKLGQGCRNYTVLTIAWWLLMAIIHPGYAAFTLLFMAANLLLLTAVITGKYAFYRPHMNIEMMISIIMGIAIICLIVPHLPPVLMLLIGWLYWRAGKRLREVVYAFH